MFFIGRGLGFFGIFRLFGRRCGREIFPFWRQRGLQEGKGFFGSEFHADADKAISAFSDDFEGDASIDDDLIEFGDIALLVDEESAEGIDGITFEVESEGIVDGFQRGSSVDGVGIFRDMADFVGFGVELVLDITDDFFEDVFHRDESSKAAVFIDDDGHVDFILLEIFEDIFDLTGFGDVEGGGEIF